LIEQGLTYPPTQYRLYWRRFFQVKRPNQQYQSTEGDLLTTDWKQPEDLTLALGKEVGPCAVTLQFACWWRQWSRPRGRCSDRSCRDP